MSRNKIAVSALCVLALICVGVFCVPWGEKEAVTPVGAAKKIRVIEKKRHERIRKLKKKKGQKRQEERLTVTREKPSVLDLEDDEESLLNDYSRKVLLELQQALDTEDQKIVSKLVMKMLETPPDPKFGKEGVSRVLRRKAVEALGWFGASALPELVGMLTDADSEIAQATFDQFTLALEDISLSDYERADIVTMAAKVLTDTENLEALFMEINNMRHSVGAGALVEICLEGTPEAKSLMQDAIEFFTGEDNIKTVEDLERWLSENPDGEDDDDLYGGDPE